MINKTNILNNSSNVSTNILNYGVSIVSSLKSVLPLNLPRVNKNYLFGFNR
jgi:hypothetical protein